MNKRAKSNTIRLISGQWRGRRLPVHDSQGLRPTTDRVRETVFNWLMHDVAGANCLDLFAGSGALGLECLSRGASRVQFVESDIRVAERLKSNLLVLNGEDTARLDTINALEYLSSQPGKAYDVVFLDPPFQSSLLRQAIELLNTNNWLADKALVYVEQSSKEPAVAVPINWQLHRQGKAGQSRFSLYTL